MGKGQPNVSNTIRQLRLDASEMTQAGLAERVGVTRQTIVAIEHGRYSPSLEVAFRIAHVLGVPLAQVFQWRPPDAWRAEAQADDAGATEDEVSS